MKTARPLPFSQLWVEEERYLCASAARLASRSVIVEIGTAQGGSAYLFARSCGDKADIYSYDLAPSAEARRNLKGLGVHVIAQASAQGAASWESACGRPIDLIFIDGSHLFANVYEDCKSWLPHLKPGARVLFHDYDRPERGGASHLGVRVFLDALLASGFLSDVDHVGRILAGTIPSPRRALPKDEAFFSAWEKIGRKARRLCSDDYGRHKVLGGKAPPAGISLLPRLLGLKSGCWLTRLRARNGPRPLLIAERPLSEQALALVRRQDPDAELVDDLSLGLLLFDRLQRRREDLLALCRDRRAFFKWEEHLEMLAHAAPAPKTLYQIFTPMRFSSLNDLSQACAVEHLRHVILWRLVETLAG